MFRPIVAIFRLLQFCTKGMTNLRSYVNIFKCLVYDCQKSPFVSITKTNEVNLHSDIIIIIIIFETHKKYM